MALDPTAPFLCNSIELPFGFGPPADGTNVGMEIYQPCGGAGGWRSGNEAVDVVLGVGRLLVAVDVVVAGFAEGLRFIHLIDQMKPVKVAPAPLIGATGAPFVVKIRLSTFVEPPGRESVHIMAAETEIEVGRAKTRGAGERIQVIGAPDAAVCRTMRTDGGGGASPVTWRPPGCSLVSVVVMAVGALDDRTRVEAVGVELRVEIRRAVAARPADGVIGAIGRLKFGLLVARRSATRQRPDSNHSIVSITVAAQANRILRRARRAIDGVGVVDDVLNDVAVEVDSPHSFRTVGFLDLVRVVAVHAFNMFSVGETRVRRGLARF